METPERDKAPTAIWSVVKHEVTGKEKCCSSVCSTDSVSQDERRQANGGEGGKLGDVERESSRVWAPSMISSLTAFTF